MNYIKKMARGCCCGSKHYDGDINSILVDLVANKLNELIGDPNNPVTVEEAKALIADKLDEVIEEIEESSEYASDSDIEDIFGY